MLQGQVFTLHDATAYNAAADILNGEMLPTQNFNAIWVWFVPTGYNGTVFFEVNPSIELGAWFPTEAFGLSTRATKITSLASPTNALSYVCILPDVANFRVRMQGGSAGTLTVYCRFTNMIRP